jgi:hypothetical protein
VAYARAHPAMRQREMAWRMVDEDVAYVSPSTVYRVLREAKLICPLRRREKRYRQDWEKVHRPDKRWATDLLHITVGSSEYYLVEGVTKFGKWTISPIV